MKSRNSLFLSNRPLWPLKIRKPGRTASAVFVPQHPQMMPRPCALPRWSRRALRLPQWPTNTSQLLGAPQGDVLGAGCRFVFSLGFKATLEKEIVPYRSPPLSSQPSGQRNICYFVTVPCRGCLGILSARMVELAVLPETLL